MGGGEGRHGKEQELSWSFHGFESLGIAVCARKKMVGRGGGGGGGSGRVQMNEMS